MRVNQAEIAAASPLETASAMSAIPWRLTADRCGLGL